MSILCIICMDHLESDENLQSTRCGHIFHRQCLTTWIQTFSEDQWRQRLANALQSQKTEMVQLRRQLEHLKKENEDLRRQRRYLISEELETRSYQVDMLKVSLECARNREQHLHRELEKSSQDCLVYMAVMGVISGTIGIAFGIYYYPYMYPMPVQVQVTCWQKMVGCVSNYINKLF